MKPVVRAVLALVRWTVSVLLLASVVLICANAFGRYVLLAPIIWAEEVLGYALVWMVYLGAVMVTWDEGHLRMDLLTRNLAGRWRRLVDFVTGALFVAVGVLIIYQSYGAIRRFTHESQVAGLPMDVMHVVVPGAFVLMLFCVLVRLLTKSGADRPDGVHGESAR